MKKDQNGAENESKSEGRRSKMMVDQNENRSQREIKMKIIQNIAQNESISN